LLIHWFDLFVLFFLAASAFWSYYRGFAKEAFSILSLVLGVWVAAKNYGHAAPAFKAVLGDKIISEIAAFATLFFLTIILVVVTGILVRRLLKISAALSAADKIAGAALGFVKGALILAIVTYPLALIPALADETVKGSVAAPILAKLSGTILEKLAPGLAKGIDGAVQKTKETGEKVKKYSEKAIELDRMKEEIEKRISTSGAGAEKPEKEIEPKEKAEKPETAKKAPVQATDEPARKAPAQVKEKSAEPLKEKAVETAKSKSAPAKKTKKETAKPASAEKGKNEKDAINESDRNEMDKFLDKVDTGKTGK